jgi:hypothetical protein
MVRATVDKKVLDTLIRAKLQTLEKCRGVRPLPVAWQEPDAEGTNWSVSGWTGGSEEVRRCEEQMKDYIALLRSNFLVTSDRA